MMQVTLASMVLLAIAAIPELCMARPAKRDDSNTPTGNSLLTPYSAI
jgi:hypothetical protein